MFLSTGVGWCVKSYSIFRCLETQNLHRTSPFTNRKKKGKENTQAIVASHTPGCQSSGANSFGWFSLFFTDQKPISQTIHDESIGNKATKINCFISIFEPHHTVSALPVIKILIKHSGKSKTKFPEFSLTLTHMYNEELSSFDAVFPGFPDNPDVRSL